MKSMFFLLYVIVLKISLVTVHAEPDYYWRNFNGNIPEDAVLAWENKNSPVYIGNVYVHGTGILIGQIYPDVTKITVTGYFNEEQNNRVHHRTEFIQILCSGTVQNFHWVRANRTEMTKINPNYLVIGGHEGNKPHYGLFVGRIKYNGKIIVGKLTPDAWNFWFPYGTEERISNDFEVLVNQGEGCDYDGECGE